MLFLVVFGIMVYSMLKHRKSVGHQPARFTGPTGTVQWLWALAFLGFSLRYGGMLLRPKLKARKPSQLPAKPA